MESVVHNCRRQLQTEGEARKKRRKMVTIILFDPHLVELPHEFHPGLQQRTGEYPCSITLVLK